MVRISPLSHLSLTMDLNDGQRDTDLRPAAYHAKQSNCRTFLNTSLMILNNNRHQLLVVLN